MTTSLFASGTLRINNLTLAVADLDGMLAWYQAVLGFALCERGRFEAVGADYAMLSFGGLHMELISRPRGVKATVDRSPPPSHLDVLGWKALVLDTDDLPTVSATLAANGVELVWADLAVSADRRSTLLRDPEGNLINIFGPRGQAD